MGIIINGQNDTIGPVDNSMSLLGTVSIGGTMTIEDFTNIDSVGLITARNGLQVTGGNVGINEASPDSKFHVNSGAETVPARFESTGAQSRIGFKASGTPSSYHVACGAEANDFIVYTNNTEKLRITSSGIINSNNYSFNSQGTNTASDVYLGAFAPGSSAYAIATNGAERLRITSAGNIGINDNTPDNTLSIKGIGSFDGDSNSFYFGSNFTGTGQNYIGSSKHAQRFFLNNASANGYFSYSNTGSAGTAGNAITWQERFRITSAGTIKCGTSATLKAEINSAIGGHQFISQCSDNNNGFEIYQQHGSTTTRNTFAVYANTGGGGAQELQFSVRGDGCVTKPTSPAFSASLSSGNLNAANYNNVIIFNNQQFDNSNSYNTGNGRFTAPVAGKYYFGVQIYAGFDFSGVRVLHSKFVKNGSDFATADMFGGTSNHGGTYYHPTGCGHILIDLAVNDWVAFNSGGFSASGTGNALIYAQGGTRFFGYLVG